MFLRAAGSEIKWVRKAGVYGLGDCAHLSDETLQAVSGLLASDVSVYVRSVAAGTLGCLGRRAAATGIGAELLPAVLDALMGSLAVEVNRLAPDIAQGRSIKFVRPTDDSDVCEGGGVDFGLTRFEPVRSSVRENALWSTVILTAQGTETLAANGGGPALQRAVETLVAIVRTDQNMIDVGFAMDALHRLASSVSVAETDGQMLGMVELANAVIVEAPMRSWESLVCSQAICRRL